MIGTTRARVLMSIWASHSPDLCLDAARVTTPHLSPTPDWKAGTPHLYIGVDIGKSSHVASLLSTQLLARHGSYERCPTLSFDQSRAGFEKLLSFIHKHAPHDRSHVLLENTGHYGRPLEQYLQEHDITVYLVHVQERSKGKNKSDKRDAQALAVLLYNQVERHVLVTDKSQLVYQLTKPSDTTRLLQGLVQHRVELKRETTRRKNKLIAITDEIFPELTQAYVNPNNPSALQLREKYPTPQAVAEASLDDLVATRKRTRPGRAKLANLQDLARQTIGTKDESRMKALLIEQKQLIPELKLLDEHVETLKTEIEAAIKNCREGQILLSLGIGKIQAAQLIAGIGSIANFESAAKLRAYCGWSPTQKQTGTSYDRMELEKAGNRLLKHTLYLIAIHAIQLDTPWKVLYNRLVPIKCVYDERIKDYRGKMKVIGRVIGQMIGIIYLLLKKDADLLASTPLGEEPPPPQLYDPSKHRVKH
jgi:transposase